MILLVRYTWTLRIVQLTMSKAPLKIPRRNASLHMHRLPHITIHLPTITSIWEHQRRLPLRFKSGRSQQNASMVSIARVPEVDSDVDALYSKPDMSRKTNKMTSLESDYDDPRPPGTNSGSYLGRNSGQDTFVSRTWPRTPGPEPY